MESSNEDQRQSQLEQEPELTGTHGVSGPEYQRPDDSLFMKGGVDGLIALADAKNRNGTKVFMEELATIASSAPEWLKTRALPNFRWALGMRTDPEPVSPLWFKV